MGSVYEATHTVMDRSVAIKILHATDQDGIRRFEREARALSSIKSPSIPDFYGWGVTPAGCPYLVMEFVDFPALSDLLGAHETLPAENVCQIAVATCEALTAIHQAGLVHRDIKPANLMVQTLPDGRVNVKVTDLGIARAASSSLVSTTQTQNVLGSIAYMSPEHYTPSALEARSDLFSLGCVLYRCLTGHAPYEGETALSAALKMRESDRAPLPDAFPAYLRNAIDRCLAVDPDERYDSAEALRQSLLSQSALPPSAGILRKHATPRRLRLKWLTLTAALAAVPICCIALSGLQKGNDSELESHPLYKQAMAVPFLENPDSELWWIKEHYSDPETIATLLRLRYKDNLANGRISRVLDQHRQLGVYLRDQGKLTESFEELMSASKEAAESREMKRLSLAITEMELGKTAFMRKDYKFAHQMLDHSLGILEAEDQHSEARAEAALQRAQLHEMNGEPLERALKDYQDALPIYRSRNAEDRELACLEGLLRVKKRMHDYKEIRELEARRNQLLNISHYREVLKQANPGDLNNLEPNQYPPQDDLIAAATYFRTVESAKETGAAASLCIRVAQTYAQQGKPAQSSKWYKDAVSLTDEVQLKGLRLNLLNHCLLCLISLDRSCASAVAENILMILSTPDPTPEAGDESVSANNYREFSENLARMLDNRIFAARPLAVKLSELVKQRSQAPTGELSTSDRLIFINCYLELRNIAGIPKSALPYLKQALPMVSALTQESAHQPADELARFWQDAGAIYLAAGRVDKALEASIAGYKSNRAAQSRMARAVTARNVAETLMKAGRIPEMKPYLVESREETRHMLAEATNGLQRTAAIRLTDWSAYALASHYLMMHDPKQAQSICEEQQRIWKDTGLESEQIFPVKKLKIEIKRLKNGTPSASENTAGKH